MAELLKDDDEMVLERIMANGTFDELRKQLLENLRTDVRQSCIHARISLLSKCRQALL